MSKKQFIKRHHLIINKLRSNPCSFKRLQDFLEMHSTFDENYVISKRTFERDVIEIGEIYSIEIKYNRPENIYEIVHDADSFKTDRIMESFQLFNALSLSESVSNQVILEKRKLLGTEHMFGLIHAIKNAVEISFIHEKYWVKNSISKQKSVQPLALKESQNRWYLIALDTQDHKIKTFGLDRISNLDITKRKFSYPKNYNPELAFEHSFGIITGEIAPQKIVLSFSFEQSKYMKSLPLHHSQNVLVDNENEFRIELFLCPTYDFVMELMSIGQEVKVLEPESLKQEIISKLKATLNQYK